MKGELLRVPNLSKGKLITILLFCQHKCIISYIVQTNHLATIFFCSWSWTSVIGSRLEKKTTRWGTMSHWATLFNSFWNAQWKINYTLEHVYGRLKLESSYLSLSMSLLKRIIFKKNEFSWLFWILIFPAEKSLESNVDKKITGPLTHHQNASDYRDKPALRKSSASPTSLRRTRSCSRWCEACNASANRENWKILKIWKKNSNIRFLACDATKEKNHNSKIHREFKKLIWRHI